MSSTPSQPQNDLAPVRVSLGEAFWVWWKIGWLSFGGPAGQIALMHRELVEQRRWISETRFLHALNYCMLLPGPEAQQLATYIGWLLHRTPGGIVAGALFVLPGFIAILALSVLYASLGQIPVVAALFFGLKAAVLALVLEALVRVSRRALKSRALFFLAGVAFIAMFAFQVPFPWIIVVAALIGTFAPLGISNGKDATGPGDARSYLIDRMYEDGELTHTRASAGKAARAALVSLLLWSLPPILVLATLGSAHVIFRESLFFSQAAVVTFGGAYAVLAYVAQRAVQELHWLTPGEMVDGLALAETTPGPLIMVLQFVGFLAAYRNPGSLDPWLAATLGAVITTWVTFVPSFMFIFVGGPYVEALRHVRALRGALTAITAAVVGVILNLTVWFALHTLFSQSRRIEFGLLKLDVPHWSTLEPGALLLSIGSAVAMLRYKAPLGWTLLASAACGITYVLLIRGT